MGGPLILVISNPFLVVSDVLYTTQNGSIGGFREVAYTNSPETDKNTRLTAIRKTT